MKGSRYRKVGPRGRTHVRKTEGEKASLNMVRKLTKTEASLHSIIFHLQQAMPIQK
jgi:hypothetical protein